MRLLGLLHAPYNRWGYWLNMLQFKFNVGNNRPSAGELTPLSPNPPYIPTLRSLNITTFIRKEMKSCKLASTILCSVLSSR